MTDTERGKRIRDLRASRGLPQRAVADQVGVTTRAYQEWEAGGNLSWSNVVGLARVLRTTPEYVNEGRENGGDQPGEESLAERVARLETQVSWRDHGSARTLEKVDARLSELEKQMGTLTETIHELLLMVTDIQTRAAEQEHAAEAARTPSRGRASGSQ